MVLQGKVGSLCSPSEAKRSLTIRLPEWRARYWQGCTLCLSFSMSLNAALHCTALHCIASHRTHIFIHHRDLNNKIHLMSLYIFFYSLFPSPRDQPETSGPAKRSLQPNRQGISQDFRPSKPSRKLRNSGLIVQDIPGPA